MVWNLIKPEVKLKQKLTLQDLQDLQVGDRVRVLEDARPVGAEPAIPAGTELKVVAVGNYWVYLKDSKQNHFHFYAALAAKRTLDNLERVE